MSLLKKIKAVNKETEILFKPRKIKIRVFGVGGGGVSIVSDLASSLKNVSFMAIDTDVRVFQKAKRGIKPFQFGGKLVKGAGTGMDLELAQRAAMEEKDKFSKFFKDQDIVILVGCLGGGVGSGVSSVLAEVAKAEKNIALGIFTLPFNFEGERKMNMAKRVIEKLRENLSGIIVVPNEKIFQFIDKKTPLKKSFSALNQVFSNWLSDWVEIIAKPGLINIDFADLKTTLLGHGAVLFLGQGIGQGPNRAEEAVKNIFSHSLLEKPTETIRRILLNIIGGKDLAIKEVEAVSQAVSRLNPRAKIIFGITEDSAYTGKIKLVLMVVSELGKKSKGNGVFEDKKKIPVKLPKNNEGKKEKSTAKPINPGNGLKIKKEKIRQTALEVKEAEKEEVEKEWAGDLRWEIPAFMLKKKE